MVNVALVIIAIILFAAIVVANFYILVYFQHEEDKNTAIFPKIIVVASLTLVCVNILLLPMDVANARSDAAIPMEILWYIVYISIGALVLIIIPFTIMYYEAEDPDKDNSDQIATAIKWTALWVAIFAGITILLWFMIGVAEIPVTKLYSPLSPVPYPVDCPSCDRSADNQLNLRVSPILYIISMLTFAGMFLFVFFGGIGLAALPMDLLNSWRKRPKRLSLEQYAQMKLKISTRCEGLISKGSKLKEKYSSSGGRPTTRRQRTEYNQFRNSVYLLEEDFNRMDKMYNRGLGPRLLGIVWAWAQLILGIL